MLVDFFLVNKKIYTLERYVTDELRRIFEEKGVKTRLIIIEEHSISNYLNEVKENPPDWTFSLTDLFLQKVPLSALTRIPHFLWETVSLSHSMHTLDSALGHVGFIERGYASEKLSFLPHGFSKRLQRQKEKVFDVVIFDDLVDCEELEKNWKEILEPSEVLLLQEVVRACQAAPHRKPIEILFEAKSQTKTALNYLLFLVEEYLKAARSRHLIECVRGRRVDVFGEHVGNNWLRRLKNVDNVYLHSSLPYTEHFEVLKETKTLLRQQVTVKDGSDEWLFAALALGCEVVTNGSPYLREVLDMPFYSTEEERQTLLENYPTCAPDLTLHTFEARAGNLLAYLSAYLSMR